MELEDLLSAAYFSFAPRESPRTDSLDLHQARRRRETRATRSTPW
jgi:hypothetical protein